MGKAPDATASGEADKAPNDGGWMPSGGRLTRSRNRHPTVRSVAWAVLALAGGAVAVYGAYTQYGRPSAVEFYKVTPVTTLRVNGPGLLDANDRVVISGQLLGRLTTLPVARGETVQRGQVVATIEAEETASQLAAWKADAEAAKKHVDEVTSERDRAQAVFEKASLDLERRRTLSSRGIVAQSDLDTAEAMFHQGKADLERSATGIDRAVAQADSAAASEQMMAARLSNATLKAPVPGIVISRDRNIGDLVRPGQKILEIVDPSSIVVSARFDESVMNQLEVGQAAKVSFVSEPGEDREGRVNELHRLVDQETREFQADIVLAQLPKNWALGQRATVRVDVQQDPHTVLVPLSFLDRRNGQGGFWFFRDGRARWGAVTLGYSAGGAVQITSGVEAGDTILRPEDLHDFESVELAKPSQG